MSLEPAEQEGQAVEQAEPEAIQANPVEDKAREGGWKPKEDWQGEPDEWRSAEVFNERGEWIDKHKAQQKRMDDLETTFTSRLDNQRKFMDQQAEAQRNELIRKRDDAIDEADREKANKFQDDIDSLKKTEDPVTNGNDNQAVMDSWNASNPWILGSDPKAAYGKQQFSTYQQQGMTAAQAISKMEADVTQAFPDINSQRHNAPLQEGGTPAGGKAKARSLTMADITSDERKFYHSMPGAWKNDAEFLQTVQDVRGES